MNTRADVGPPRIADGFALLCFALLWFGLVWFAKVALLSKCTRIGIGNVDAEAGHYQRGKPSERDSGRKLVFSARRAVSIQGIGC